MYTTITARNKSMCDAELNHIVLWILGRRWITFHDVKQTTFYPETLFSQAYAHHANDSQFNSCST